MRTEWSTLTKLAIVKGCTCATGVKSYMTEEADLTLLLDNFPFQDKPSKLQVLIHW